MNKTELLNFLDNWENMELLFKNEVQAKIHFPILMEIALSGNERLNWRASWAADRINELIPGIAAGWIEKLISILPGLNHSGKKRQFLKLISLYPIPEHSAGFLFDYCLDKISSDAEEISVRAYSMQILYNISEIEPELKTELLQILEEQLEHNSSAGIATKSKNLIKKLKKDMHPRK